MWRKACFCGWLAATNLRSATRGATCIVRPSMEALDLLRRRNAAASEPLDSASGMASQGRGSQPEAEAASSQLVQWLRAALGDLSPRAAEMFTLRYVEELDNREIALADERVAGRGGRDAAPGASQAEEAAHRDGTGEPMKNHDEVCWTMRPRRCARPSQRPARFPLRPRRWRASWGLRFQMTRVH